LKLYKQSVNFNNIKNQLNEKYFLYKEIFNKFLVIYFYIYQSMIPYSITNIMFEDSFNQQLYSYLTLKSLNNKQIFIELNLENYVYLYLDFSLYIESLFRDFYKLNSINSLYLLGLNIEDNGYITIYFRKINNSLN